MQGNTFARLKRVKKCNSANITNHEKPEMIRKILWSQKKTNVAGRGCGARHTIYEIEKYLLNENHNVFTT